MGVFLPSVRENSENSQGILILIFGMNPVWAPLAFGDNVLLGGK